MMNRYGDTPTVLVLNESIVAITVRETLEVEGYHVIERSDPLEALEEATDYTQASIPSVILVRLDNASEDDLSIVDLFHSTDGLLRNVPVLIVSSTDNDEAAELLAAACSEHGCLSASPDGATDAVNNLVKARAAGASA